MPIIQPAVNYNRLKLTANLPTLPKIASFGDSLMNTHSRQDPTGLVYPSRSVAGWLCACLQGQARMEHAGNFGVSGERTDQILLRLSQVVAYAPDICIVDGGANDIRQAVNTVDQMVSNITTYLGGLLTAGIKVLYTSISTMTDSAFAGPTPSVQRQKALAVNEKVRRWAYGRVGIVIFDVDPFFADPATGLPNLVYTIDVQLHWNGRVGFLLGNAMAQIIRRGLPNVDRLPSNFLDRFDAVNFPQGSYAFNPNQTGSGGAVANAFTTGPIPASWGSLGPTGTPTAGTMVYSQEARAVGLGNWSVLTVAGVTGGSATDVCGLQQGLTYASFAAGDVVELVGEFDWTAGAGLKNIYLDITEADGSGTSQRNIFGETTNNDLMPANTSGGPVVLTAPRLTVRPSGGGGSKFVQVRVGAIFDLSGAGGAANAVLKVGRVGVRKVN